MSERPKNVYGMALDKINDLTAELERVKGERDQLRRYVGTEDTRSDFPTAAHMRASLEYYRQKFYDVQAKWEVCSRAVADADLVIQTITGRDVMQMSTAEEVALDRFRNRKGGAA